MFCPGCILAGIAIWYAVFWGQTKAWVSQMYIKVNSRFRKKFQEPWSSMCDNEGIIDILWETLSDTYKYLKRWYTGITHNCDCNGWVKGDYCSYYYIITPSITKIPKCKGWKVCPRITEIFKWVDYEEKSVFVRIKERFNKWHSKRSFSPSPIPIEAHG